jgi:hypothetical protein
MKEIENQSSESDSELVTKNRFSEFKCDICKNCYSSGNALKEHIERVHQRKRPFKCNFCNHRAFKKSELGRHLKIHAKNRNTMLNNIEEIDTSGQNEILDDSFFSDKVSNFRIKLL